MFLVLRGTSVEGHGDDAACEMRRGILVLCLSAGSPAQTDAATTVQKEMSWLNMSPERIFSPLFPLLYIYTDPLSCHIAALTTKGKHSSVFSSNCLYFAGCLCWIFFCCTAVWLWERKKLWSAPTKLILNAWKYLKYIYQNYRLQWATLTSKLCPAHNHDGGLLFSVRVGTFWLW